MSGWDSLNVIISEGIASSDYYDDWGSDDDDLCDENDFTSHMVDMDEDKEIPSQTDHTKKSLGQTIFITPNLNNIRNGKRIFHSFEEAKQWAKKNIGHGDSQFIEK